MNSIGRKFPLTANAVARVPLVLAAFVLLALSASAALAGGKYLYVQSGNVQDGKNSIVAYERTAGYELKPLAGSPFLTDGTGIDNSTNGKLGPNDNDTPIISSADGKRLFAVNGHSNTIAVFDVHGDGSLSHVQGSPFKSMGVGPVSLAIRDDVLLVANRNEDPHQLSALRGGGKANYASFKIKRDGRLEFVSKVELETGLKPTQVLLSARDDGLVFGNEFVVDVDFDGDGNVSRLFGKSPSVSGKLRTMTLDKQGRLAVADAVALQETASPAPDVPSIPLGIWDHPKQKLLYVGFVTRNELGVYSYDDDGKLTFVTAVPNSGQDICWLRVNRSGTRLYAVNNLPREDAGDTASTVTVFDISGQKARKPVEMDRVQLPISLGTFVNNRNMAQPNSTAFQLDIDPSGRYLCVLTQRIDQTESNTSEEGNILHILEIDSAGTLKAVMSRHLGQDGVHYRARPQGIVTLDT